MKHYYLFLSILLIFFSCSYNEKELTTQTYPYSPDVNQYDTQTNLPEGAIARFGKGGINVMEFSPSAKYLAVGTDIGVWVYDSVSGKERLFSKNTIGQSNALAFSPNGRILASGGSSNPNIQLWIVETGEHLLGISLPISVNAHLMNRREVTHVKSVAALTFSQDSSTLLSISFSGVINYWDVGSGENISEHHSKFDSEGVLALSQDGSTYGCGYWNGEIWSGNPSTGQQERVHKGHSSSLSKLFKNTKYRRVRALTFSPDGTLFASGSENKKVQIWNTVGNRRLATFKEHKGWVTALSFSKDAKLLASGGTDNIVMLWDVHKKRSITILSGHINGILAMTFSPDGKTLATGSADGTIRFWDVPSRQPVSTFATGHTELVQDITFSHDSKKVSIAHYNGTVEKWEISPAKRLKISNKFTQHLTLSVRLSPDGTHLACHNIIGNISFNSQGWQTIIEYLGNDIIRIYNLDTEQELPQLTEAYGPIAFSCDNNLLASKSSYDIVPWERTTDSEVGTRFSSKTVGKSKDIFIFETQTGVEIFRIHLAERGRPLGPGGLNPYTPMLFSYDNSVLGAGQNLYSVDEWNSIVDLGGKDSHIVAYSQDNTTVAIQDDRGYEKNIHLWQISIPSKPKKLNTIYLPYTIDNRAVALSTNGSILVEATKYYFDTYCDAIISLWDVDTGDKLISLQGHTEHIESLTFSPDGKILASGSEDGTVLLWNWDKIVSNIMHNN